jgi:uncharacterized protein YndB with AHSA1/START domain
MGVPADFLEDGQVCPAPTRRRQNKFASVAVGPLPLRPSLGQTLAKMEEPMAHEMTFTRLLDAPGDTLYRLWLDPDHLGEWFCPKPWTVTGARIEPRAGGAFNVTMAGPNGEKSEMPGQYLELVSGKKIVFSDAFSGDWNTKDGAPFMVGIVEFAPEGDKTRYTCTVRHWSEEARAQHEQMGFYTGWGIVADQLEALAKTI